MKGESKGPTTRATARPPARRSNRPPEEGPKRRETVEVELDWVELTDAVQSTQKDQGLKPPPIPGVDVIVPPLPVDSLVGEIPSAPVDEAVGAGGSKRRQTMEVHMDWVELLDQEKQRMSAAKLSTADVSVDESGASAKRAKVIPIPREEDDAPPIARPRKKNKKK